MGGILTTWVTFVPCFLWIFLGAPFIEQLRGNVALGGALSAITAAVVGVVLNLAIWFALHVMFAEVREYWAGALQFDVVRYRLEAEYNVQTEIEPLGYSAARWVRGEPAAVNAIGDGRGRMRAEDREGKVVILFTTEWDLRYAEENAKDVEFSDVAFPAS